MAQDDTVERDPITLGGRVFRVIDFNKRTVRIDHYLAKLLRESGADKAMPMDGEEDAVYLTRMQTLLVDSGKVPELIAGLILPEGMSEKQWTPTVAKATAEHIGQCDTEEDRMLVMELAMQVVFGFFKQGLVWLTRSLRSLQAAGLLDDEEVASPPETLKTS